MMRDRREQDFSQMANQHWGGQRADRRWCGGADDRRRNGRMACDEQGNPCPKPHKRKITLLFFLVAFVFFVLLVSMAIASSILYLLDLSEVMKPLTQNSLPVILTFMLIISLLTGTVITLIAGNLSLRPLKGFVDATKQIAAGNFDVRVKPRGPDEFSRLADSFNEMAEELGSIETLRDDFVNNISHEYKTPIVSIRGFAKLLKKDDLPNEKRDEYLDIIISEADRLTQLSSNVLLLSKLDNTDRLPDISEFSLDEQVRQVILMMDQQMGAKDLDVSVDLEPCTITSNEELLRQVWINLISNAIKFSPVRGHITVEMAVDDATVRVMVQDAGIGMDEDDLKHLFDKFYQGEGSRSSEGNGLGLALVHKIVDLGGGSVEVSSTPGKGSVFAVALPKKSSDA